LYFYFSFVLVVFFIVSVQPKHAVSILNQNKRLVSDRIETSFGCFESKLVS
jgi:hypothetical protein